MKNKKMKLKLIIISVVVIIIALIIAVLFLFTDVFRTKRGAFFRYIKLTSSNLELLENNDFENIKKVQETMPYIINGEMKVQSSSNIADSSIMDKLSMTVNGKVNNANEKFNYNISVSSSSNELFSASLVRNKNIYAFTSPQIANGYIGIKNENLSNISKAIIGDIYIPNEITKLQFDKILEVSKVEKSHIDEYYKLLKNSSSDTAFSKSSEKLEIDGKSYNTVSYKLKLENKESANIQEVLLGKLTQDSIMMDYLTSRFKLLNLPEEYTDINTLNIRMREKIEKLQANPDSAETIEITVYEQKQKNIKTTVKINDFEFSIIRLSEDNKEALFFESKDGKLLKIAKEGENKVIKYFFTEDDIEKSIEFKYRVEGTIEENNLNNIIEITTVNGIKVVNYLYKGKMEFTSDIGAIDTLDENNSAILNNYTNEQIVPFINQLKNKINNLFITQGASIGINLNPIFKMTE